MILGQEMTGGGGGGVLTGLVPPGAAHAVGPHIPAGTDHPAGRCRQFPRTESPGEMHTPAWPSCTQPSDRSLCGPIKPNTGF